MIHALEKLGIDGKFLTLLKAMYSDTKGAVKVNEYLTGWFQMKAGVKQGQNDLPTIFATFLNSLAVEIKNLSIGVNFGNVKISILLYADDIVLIAENERDLQKLIGALMNWCTKWRMIVNLEKTQVVHFRPIRKSQTPVKFYLGKNEITKTEEYKYLGCKMDKNMNSKVTGDSLAEGASRALGKLLAKYYSNHGLGYQTYTNFYNTCILPILNYASGIWGYNDNVNINKIHNRAIRCYLGVGRYAPSDGQNGDMRWVSPIIHRKLEIVKYWNRLMGMEDDRLPKKVYKQLKTENGPWYREVKAIMNDVNMLDYLNSECSIINFKPCSEYIINTLMEKYANQWWDRIDNKPKLVLYKQIKSVYETENYVSLCLKRGQRSMIAKLRLGILLINVELGRYNGTERQNRVCPLCNKGAVEDEIHILFYCEFYNEKRKVLYETVKKQLNNSDEYNHIRMLHALTTHRNLIRPLARFLQELFQIRNSKMRIM